jgi:hypothetical protein
MQVIQCLKKRNNSDHDPGILVSKLSLLMMSHVISMTLTILLRIKY